MAGIPCIEWVERASGSVRGDIGVTVPVTQPVYL